MTAPASSKEGAASQLVLVADADAARAARLVRACRSASLACRAASNGATALELALAEPPALVVAPLGLPLVDGAKLAEILRANPRTRLVRFVFLREGEGEGEAAGRAGPGAGDVVLPASRTAEEVVRTARELLARQERMRALDAEGHGGVVEGELEELPLAELLQILHWSGRSGRIELARPEGEGGPERGRIVVRDGEVIHAESGSAEREKALYRLLAWRGGHFRIEPGAGDLAPRILRPTSRLLAEGVRHAEERERLGGRLPPLDAAVKLCVASRELPHAVHPLTQEVLQLIECYESVREVVDHSGYPDYQVLRTLHTLAQRGIVRIGRLAAPGLATAGRGLLNEAQGRRLREWLRTEGGESTAPAKLLVAAADAAGARDFANLLARIPGLELAPGVERGELAEADFTPLARLVVDDETSLELLHVPVAERFAPLWPLVGHGALGTIVLLGAPVGAGIERLRALVECLHRAPRARIFHVMLLRKGERVSPEDLRENLSLIDESSLFLLPLEAEKEPSALLRSLFSRLVP